MKKLLLIHFLIALIVTAFSGPGFLLPIIMGIILILVQRITRKFDLIQGELPAWYLILAVCYTANLLVLLISWIL